MTNQLLRTKSLDAILSESEAPHRQLKRVLGAFDVLMLGIGAIVGAGIFATIGTAAAGDALRPGAGPALIVSFVVTAVAFLWSVYGMALPAFDATASYNPIYWAVGGASLLTLYTRAHTRDLEDVGDDEIDEPLDERWHFGDLPRLLKKERKH